jgi:hypothetical protein
MQLSIGVCMQPSAAQLTGVDCATLQHLPKPRRLAVTCPFTFLLQGGHGEDRADAHDGR